MKKKILNSSKCELFIQTLGISIPMGESTVELPDDIDTARPRRTSYDMEDDTVRVIDPGKYHDFLEMVKLGIIKAMENGDGEEDPEKD